MKRKLLVIAILFLPAVVLAQAGQELLKGAWSFGLDPVKVGEKQEWFLPEFPLEKWDKVNVPHCFSVDPRYQRYTGDAWYFKRFSGPALPDGYRAFIRFEAVFYKTKVWLNGKVVGEHEGGYTPFEFDITDALADYNALAIRVNNAWDTTTIPGAKTEVPYQSHNMAQMFPWINYGGITREVKFIVRPPAYIVSMRVDAVPNLEKKTAQLRVVATIKNTSREVLKRNRLAALISQSGRNIPVTFRISGEDVAPDSEGVINLEASLPARDVQLWNVDNPVLYQLALVASHDTVRTTFGIRKVELRGTRLLLNGESVSMGGCNRPLDYPGYGSMDPIHVLEEDLRLIKSAGMELSRISHYPVSTQMLDWADRHGMLIIAEAGNWQMTQRQLEDPAMRAKFRLQMKEMVERDWNHPSVIAWSVGNEYQSQTGEGKAWTRDMYAFTKSLDPSRLITFATNIAGRESIQKAEDEASQYVDFISANIYGSHLKTLQHIHELYPDKPIYVSEFGLRTDDVDSEEDRIAYLKKAMEDFRQCDFVIGASVWTFNDYQSSFPLTNANGYRPFGLVSPGREPRGMYFAAQEEFSPATISVEGMDAGKTKVIVTVRTDFPRYTLRNYKLKVSNQSFDIGLLKPGESKTFLIERDMSTTGKRTIELIKPGGFILLKKEY